MKPSPAGEPACKQFSAWLQHFAANPADAPIPAHPQDCPRCRGRLLAWLCALNALMPHHAISCGQCESDLGAFVELELADVEQAYRWYPAVWHHLWICAACLEQYDLLYLSLADPELRLRHPSLRPALPVRIPSGPPARRHLLDLMSAAIHAILGTRAGAPFAYRMPPAGSSIQFEMIESTLCFDSETCCRIDTAFHDAETCRLIIRLDPPRAGQVLMSRATSMVTAPLADGEAVILLPLKDLGDQAHDHFALFLLPAHEPAA